MDNEKEEMNECLKCEEIIRQAEFEDNNGLCNKCYKRFKLKEALNQ